MKFYELHEVIQELRKNEKLVFKIVLVKNGEMIDDGLGKLYDDHEYAIKRLQIKEERRKAGKRAADDHVAETCTRISKRLACER